MLRASWTLWWLFEWYVIVPLVQRRRRVRLLVSLAVWADRRRSTAWIQRGVCRYWGARNWWLDNVWSTEKALAWRFHCLDWARPKCPDCGKPLRTPACVLCMFTIVMQNVSRKRQLDALTSGRQRYGSSA